MLVTQLIAAIAATGSAAAAQPAPPPPAQPPIVVTGEKQAAEEKAVCKQVSTGTMFPKKVCRTKSEWAKAETDAEQTMKQMRDWQRVRCNYGVTC